MATPQPDPTDKRQPGLTPSYIQQVSLSFDNNLCPVTGVDMRAHILEVERPPSRRLVTEQALTPSIILPIHPFVQKELVETGVGKAVIGSVFTPFKRDSFCHRTTSVSSISYDPIHASDFSKPSSSPPVLDHDQISSSPSSHSLEALIRLTGNCTQKNTPPLTPRAMSSERNQFDDENSESPPTTSDPSPKDEKDNVSATVDEITEGLDDAFPSHGSSPSKSSSAPTVGSLKGKLNVKISEARGLHPSYAPYVICVFEWNEFVSNGPQNEEDAALERRRIRRELEPEGGRGPMAIPMKSPNSSSSLTELHEYKEKPVTDPHWNLEAAL